MNTQSSADNYSGREIFETPRGRSGLYVDLYNAELRRAAKRHGGYLTGAQRAAVKANATKKFFALEKAAQA